MTASPLSPRDMPRARLSRRRPGVLVALSTAAVLALLAVTAAVATATAATCAVCGKNLIKNPGAETGIGLTAVNARGVVPGWTNVAGQFGAASYTFANGWFSARSKGSTTRGKNYFFGGTTTEAVQAKATIGKQEIALPAVAAGRKATLSGWLGNYGTGGANDNRVQVRAELTDASGAVVAVVRLGPDTTISGMDMAWRSRSVTVPAGVRRVSIVVTFAGGTNYKLAGADDLSLVLT